MNAVDVSDDLGQQIKEHRLRKNLSQLELARLLDVSLRTIWSWEAGLTAPRYKKLRAVDEFLAS